MKWSTCDAPLAYNEVPLVLLPSFAVMPTFNFARHTPVPSLVFVAATVLSIPQQVLADIDFDRQVAPILAAHCLECHGDVEPEGGLSLKTADGAMKGGESGTAIVAGKVEDSLLYRRVEADEMPPKHPIDPDQKRILSQWIAEGARWGSSPIDPFARSTSTRAGRDWWSLQRLADPPPQPPSGHGDKSATEIDRFVLAKLAAAGLEPSPVAEPRALVRRLYFDLIGLPPPPEVVESFASDPSREAYEAIVDQLLASDHYGERWARHWLDVVRFGESDGFERNNPRKNAWPYRDWVIEALNQDMPYDQFVRMQLIGDQIVGGIEGAAATGFWVAGVHNTVVGGSKRMKALARQDELEEVLATVGQTFLGLTVNCARCHDHKFDPITQKEFYRLASAISGLGVGERDEKSAQGAAQLKVASDELRRLHEQLSSLESHARDAILTARKQGKAEPARPPQPMASWEFDSDLKDDIGSLHGTAVGDVRFENNALVLEGNAYVETGPLDRDVREKTLEVWVAISDLNQRGGGAITLETRNGVVFDSIVFAEQESKRWMPGSNGFVRTSSFGGTDETDASNRPVHVVIVYHADGTILGYRDGKPYGKPVKKGPLQEYKAGDCEIIFGLRHKPVGGNRHLNARLHRAAFYDRALSAEEVAASSGDSSDYVSESQLVQWLDEPTRQRRDAIKKKIAAADKARQDAERSTNQKIYSLKPGGGIKTNVLLRGDPDSPGDVVTPGAVAAVPGVDAEFGLEPTAPESERRRKLAEWIADRDNPLFSRVIVNRVWHYHFGRGLVDTPNDFGFNGGRPSHPELLEWLAVRFREGGFRLKALHRQIVTSQTWMQAGYSESSRTGRAKDPSQIDADNRLLWRMNPRRLEAECVRDAMLMVSGSLNARMGGPSFEDVSITSNNGTMYYEPIDVSGDDFFRRTVYRFNPRGGRSALLDTFDCPDPAATAPKRAVTTTPLQALSLLNNVFVLRMSDALADRIEREAGDDVDARVDLAWRLTVCRLPTEAERKLSADLLRKHGLSSLCRGLFNSNEFVIIE